MSQTNGTLTSPTTNGQAHPPRAVVVGTPDGRFDHLRCGTCGRPFESHSDICTRHDFRPTWARWLEANPNPWAALRRKIAHISYFGGSDLDRFERWTEAARAAGVPEHVIDPALWSEEFARAMEGGD